MKGPTETIDLPSRDETLAKMDQLRDGLVSPEDASDWARKWIVADQEGIEVRIEDWAVWDALMVLFGCDMKHGNERPYLHGQEDFAAWAAELRAAPRP